LRVEGGGWRAEGGGGRLEGGGRRVESEGRRSFTLLYQHGARAILVRLRAQNMLTNTVSQYSRIEQG
jgi:hypothetical protein